MYIEMEAIMPISYVKCGFALAVQGFIFVASSGCTQLTDKGPETATVQQGLASDQDAIDAGGGNVAGGSTSASEEYNTFVDMGHLSHQVPKEVLEAAEIGIDRWGYMLGPIISLNGLAKLDDEQRRKVKLGIPYKLVEISWESLKNNNTSSGGKYLIKTNNWYFPIIRDGLFVKWMMVTLLKDGWEAAGVGGGDHAKIVGQFEKTNYLETADVERYFVTLRAADITYIAIKRSDQTEIEEADFYEVDRSNERSSLVTFGQAVESMKSIAIKYGL